MVIKKSLEKYLEMCVLNLKYIFIKFLFKSLLTSSNIYIYIYLFFYCRLASGNEEKS